MGTQSTNNFKGYPSLDTGLNSKPHVKKMALTSVLVVLLLGVLGGHGFEFEVRGLNPSNKNRYHPGKDFTCLDGSDTIAFSMG